MAYADKRESHHLTTDNTRFWDESMDLQMDCVERDVLPMAEEKLYKRILYGITKSPEDETYKCELRNYVQAAFRVTDALHNDLLDDANQEIPAEICLNVDVIEAQQLDTKNSNGLANPFVTMHIESLALHQCTTSIKSNTLNPSWEEQFSLPLANGIDNDHLIVEVWHSNAVETMREKIKSPRQFGKFIKKIAIVSSGSHDHELIGRCTIPLKTIPASGLCTSHCLYKNDKPKLRGSIALELSIGASVSASKKFNTIIHHDQKNLLRIILQHELKMSRSASQHWPGQLSDLGEAIIAYSGHKANARAHALAKWSAFTAFYPMHALSLELFENLLMELLPFLKCHKTDTQKEMDVFWDGVKILLPSCFMAIRRSPRASDIDTETIRVSVAIVSTINAFAPPQDIELFPKQIYGWLNEPNGNIGSAVEEAIRSRAQDYLLEIAEFQFVHQENIESNLKNIIKVMESIELDLQQAKEVYNKLFLPKMHCDYAAICYNYYANEIGECFDTTIKRTCEHLVRTSIPISPEGITIGATLFDVYLVLKRFAMQSRQYCSESMHTLKIHNYADWFADGVAYWLDMHHAIAVRRVKKAIEMDKLIPVDEMVKYSTSAIDTLAILQSIKEFWLHLNWPDIEISYTFMAKIVDDICHCCVCYADQMAARIFDSSDIQNRCANDEFYVTPNSCTIINNINHLRENLSKFIAELETDEIITKLAAYRSHADAQRCQQTLNNFVENAVDTIENQLAELIEYIAYKLCTHLHKWLLNAAEHLHQDLHLIDQLMENLEKSLHSLSTNLNEMNVKQCSAAVWQKFKFFFNALLQNCLDTHRSPQFYANLHECLKIIIKSFKCNTCGDTQLVECEPIVEFERFLRLHGRETDTLIHQYYVDRYKQQMKLNGTPFGQLTIRANFTEDHFLELEILNARNLVSNANGNLLDPFVQIEFSPNDRDSTKMKFKTAAQKDTLFPLFDQKFVIPISKKQQSSENCLIIFSIKNHDRFGMSNKFVAECFITLDEIKRCTPKQQVHLTLSFPTSLDGEYFAALKLRDNDKIAKKFIKNLKRKLSSLAK